MRPHDPPPVGTAVTRRGRRARRGVVVAAPEKGTWLAALGLVSVTWSDTGVTELCSPNDLSVIGSAVVVLLHERDRPS